MPKLWIDTPRMTDGVSQQPDSRRFRTQAEEIINAHLGVVEGLDKRNGSEYVNTLDGFSDVSGNQWHHWIERDGENYLVMGNQPQSSGGQLRVYDLSGTQIHVEDTASSVAGGTGSGAAIGQFDYIQLGTTSTEAFEQMRAMTVADFTYIVNRGAVPTMDTAFKTTSPADGGPAYIAVTLGNYNIKYTVELYENSGTPTFQTITTETYDGTTATGSQISSIDTADIAEDLRTKLNALTGITATRVGSVVKLVGSAGHELVSIKALDGVGDSSMAALYQEADTFLSLPLVCEHGFKLRITGDPTIGGDDYFIRFVADDPTNAPFGEGVWEQTIAHDTEYQFDADTMPHLLVRRQAAVGSPPALPSGYQPSSGEIYFEFQVGTWGERIVGDAELVPDPSFVGTPIENVFLFKNRVGFLADDNVIMSEVNGFFNFWRTDLANLLDSDTIDISISHPEVALARQVAAFEDDLIVFTERDQFRLKGSDTLTPKTATLTHVTSTRADVMCPPEVVGTGALFAQQNDQFSRVFELYRRGDSDLFDTVDLTEQSSKYIPGRIRDITTSSESNMAAVLLDDPSSENRGQIYIYKWHWRGNQRIQSAWSHWDFDSTNEVRAIRFYQDTLYLVISRAGGVHLERLETQTGGTDLNQSFRVKMDCKSFVIGSITYDVNTNESEIPLPFDLRATDTPQVITWSYQTPPIPSDAQVGVVRTDLTTPGDHKLYVLGDWTSTIILWVGIAYDMEYTFPSVLAKEPTDSGEKPVHFGPQQVFEGLIAFEESGPFRVEVTPRNQGVFTYPFTARIVGDPVRGNWGAQQQTWGGEHKFPVMADARDVTIKVINSGPYPSKLQKAEWLINHRIGFGRFTR